MVSAQKEHALLPFLRAQSQNALTRLYSRPSACLSVLRWDSYLVSYRIESLTRRPATLQYQVVKGSWTTDSYVTRMAWWLHADPNFVFLGQTYSWSPKVGVRRIQQLVLLEALQVVFLPLISRLWDASLLALKSLHIISETPMSIDLNKTFRENFRVALQGGQVSFWFILVLELNNETSRILL